MIVKYRKDKAWCFFDNVRQVAHQDINCNELIIRYDAMPVPIEGDSASYFNGEKLPVEIATANKVFSMAIIDLQGEGFNRHTENLIDGLKAMENYPASTIFLYVEERKEYDAVEVVLVTNQPAYLMNDKGQTIERLV